MPTKQCLIHQLPEWEAEGLSPSYEYLLPAVEIPENHRAVLDPWIRQFQGMDPSRAAQTLQERWNSIHPGPLRDLIEHFLQYRPVSVVVRGEKSWLRCVLPETASRHLDWFLLPGPDDLEALSMQLSEREFADPRAIASFLGALSGWREDWEPSSGVFLHARYECRFLDEDWMRDAIREFDEWAGALLFYSARNGDTIVVHPAGRIGWWRPEELCIIPFAKDIAEMSHKLLFHYCHNWRDLPRGLWDTATESKKCRWPLDSFVGFDARD